MKRSLLTMFIILAMLTSACASNLSVSSIDEITIYQTSNFDSDDLELLVSYEEKDSIRNITKAINRSSKLAGTVDVDDPNYELVIMSNDKKIKEYYLWSSEMGSAVMDKEDTHSYYRIKEKDHEKIRNLLNSL